MKTIILDRDGVINFDSAEYIKSPEEWLPIPGSLAAIAKLNQAGYKVAVATNQSGVGRGYYSIATLNQIHAKMHQALQAAGGHLDYIAYCPHSPDAGCACRKPKPGLLLEIADKLAIDLAQAIMVGDSLRDLEAAAAVGCGQLLVLTGKGEQTLAKHGAELTDTAIYSDLSSAIQAIIA